MQSYPDTDRTSGVPIYRINSHSISLPLPSASNTDLASLHREAVLHDAAHADAHAHAHARTRVTTDSSLDALPENKARSGTILQRLAHGVEGLVVFPELQVSESASLNVFELTHPVRRAAIALARLPSYKWTLLLLIVLDCIMQAFEDPTVALSPFFYYSRVIFTACYVFELLVAVVVMGLWQPPSAYLRSLWHVIDLAVVLGSILSLSGVHHVRFLVVLRPIRILSLSRGLRSLSLLSVAAGALLFNSLMLFIMMTFLFALFGLQVFQGLLHRRCVDVATGELEGRLTEDGQHIDVVCGGDYHCQSTSVCVGGFENPNHGVTGFDNLGQSLLTIFQALTLEGWTQIMYMTQDAGHWAAGLFFIVIVLFGSFFVVNLALAIVKAHFSNYGMLADARKAAHRLFMRVRRGSTIMSEKAQLLSSRAPITREGLLGVRDRVVRASVQLATHRYFQRTFLTLIILNILVMAMAYHGMPEAMERTLFGLNVAFTLAFALEMIVMHVGLGLSRYWNDRMNAFDGIVVIVSLLELAISSSGALGALRAVRAVRVLRMLRVLRVGKLVRHVYTLQRIAWIIKSSIDEIGYVALLLFLAMFFFTLLGKHLFAHQFDFPAEPKPRANFDDFTHSFLTVFQLLTAEEWDTVMYNAIRGRSWWASLFFIVWILLGVYFLLNMFFAIVLQNFERDYAERIERKRIKLQRKRLRKRRRPSRLVYSGLNKSLSRQTSAPGSGTPGSGESPAYVGRGILLPPAASPQLSPGPTPPGRRPLTKSSSFTNLKRSKSDPTKEAASAMVPASADASPSISARRQRARSQQLLAEREQRQLQLLNAAGGGTSHSASNSDLLLTPGASPGLSPADSPQFGRSRENSRDRSYSGLGAYNLAGLDDDLLANDDPATAFSWWRLLCGCRRAPRSSDEAEELASYDRKLRRQSLEIRPLDVVDTGPVAGSDAATDLVNTAKFELHKQSMRGQAPAPVPHPNPPPLDLPPRAPRLQIDLDSSPTSSTSSSVTSSHSTDQLAVSIPSSASYVGGSDDPRRQSLLSLPALAELDETLASPAITPTHSQASAVSPPSPLSLRKQPRKHSLSSDDVLSIPQGESLTLPNVKMTRSLSVDPQPQDQAEVRRQTVLKRAQMQRSQSFSTVQAFDGDVHRYSDAVQAAQEAARRHQEAVAAGHLIQHTDGTYSLGAFKLHRLHIMDHVFAEELWYAKLTHVVHHRLFHGFIFLCIVASTIALAFESPDDEDGGREHDVFFIIDVLFTAIFGVEMVLKMLVLGVAGRQNAYFASNWNRLDAFIVACGVISLSLSGVDVSVLRGLRFLRLMRPLRVISRSEGMRTVINALLLTLPIMANVLFVLFLVYLVFGILAMELFSGRFFSCNVDVSLDKAACRAAGGDWVNARRNFDNIFHSLLTLFEVATLEGYLEIMYNAVDSTSHDAAPVRDHNLGNAFFFVFFIFVASFFLHGLFVGVVFDTFVKLRDDYTGFGFLTPLQKLWVELQMTVLGITPVTIALPPEHPLRRWCHRVISHDYFDPFIYATIGVNTICMALSHDDEPPALQLFINYSNLVFTGVFLVEAALKLIGMGVGVYFADGWNRFDFVVLIGSLIESALFLAASSAKVNFNLIRILRVFRVTRLLHLVAAWDGLYRLLRTLFISLPSLRNVGTLLALMYFVYAVLGVKAFGLVESGECLDRNANFSTFPRAVLTLFRISTGEEWECIMHDCMDESRGGSKFAWVYFVSFVAIVSFIVLNLFIAIILDNFSSVMRREATGSELAQRAKLLDPRVVDGFVTAWARLDPNATKYIPSKKLEALLRRIPPPLGLGMDAGWRDVLEYVRDLHIPVHPGDRIHFTEVLFALVEGRAGMALPESQLQRDIGKRMKQNLPSLKVQMKPYMTFAVYMVVVRAQRAWRRNRQARIEKRREERRAAGLPSDDEDERKEPEVEADPSAAEEDPDSPVQVEIELAEITVSPVESDDAEETSPRQQASAEPERGRPTTPPPAVDED